MLRGHARPRQWPFTRHRGTSKWKRPSCPTWHGGSSIFQQLDNALGTPLPAVIKGYATLRDAKLTEGSNDKVVMWTGGSYDYDDVVRALVRLDRPEMRPGTSGQSGKTIPTYFTDPEVDAPTIVAGSEIWTQPRMDRPHCALQEDVDFCEDGETTIARDGAIAIPWVLMVRRQLKRMRFRRYCCRLDQLFRHPEYRAVREDRQCCAESPEVSSAPDEVQVAEIRDRA